MGKITRKSEQFSQTNYETNHYIFEVMIDLKKITEKCFISSQES